MAGLRLRLDLEPKSFLASPFLVMAGPIAVMAPATS